VEDDELGPELFTAISKAQQVLSTREKDLTGLEEHITKLGDSEEAAAKSAIKRLSRPKESHAKEAKLLRDSVEAIERAMEIDELREETWSALMSEKEAEHATALEEEKAKLARKLTVARQDVEMFKVQTRDAGKAKTAAEAALKSAEKAQKGVVDAKEFKAVKAELEKLRKQVEKMKKSAAQAAKLLQEL
jgi:chromosome segregation ATPase